MVVAVSTGGQINGTDSHDPLGPADSHVTTHHPLPSTAGVGRFIKEHLPSCQLIAAEPRGSTILHADAGSYYNAGSGLDHATAPVEQMLADRRVTTHDLTTHDHS